MKTACSYYIRTFELVIFFSLALLSCKDPTKRSESEIRAIVDQENTGKKTAIASTDEIKVTDFFPKPIIGNKLNAEENKLVDSFLNNTSNRTKIYKIIKIVVSRSADLAYEYGENSGGYDSKKNGHVEFHNYYLRVWRKVDNIWTIDVFFQHIPYPLPQ